MNYQNSQQLTIQQALSRAKKAAKKGKIANAVELYTASLQQQPNHPIAKKALRKLRKSSPQNQSVETETSSPSQGQIDSLVNLYQSGQMTETEQACRELLETHPQSLIVTNILTNNGESESQWIAYRAGTNLYYDINAYNSISSDINFSGRYTPFDNLTKYTYTTNDDTIYTYNSEVDSEKDTKKIEWNTDYTKTFDDEDKELSMAFQIGARIKDEDTYISEQNDAITLTNINDEKNIEQTFQIDYTYPIQSHELEIGGKIINRDQEMQYTTTSKDRNYMYPTEIFNYMVGS